MSAVESFTGGQPLSVDYSAIERELKRLWKEASEPAAGETRPAVMRACELNLIVWCEAAGEAERAAATVAEVMRRCPSRALMAVVDPRAAGDRLEAAITAHCSFTPGGGPGKQVCCEQISITGSRPAAVRLPAAVLPLLLPDLPVVLWCAGDPDLRPGDPVGDAARRLIDASDRMIVDSRRFGDLATRCTQLAALGCPLSDLSWHRLRGWRELTAGLFDDPGLEDCAARLDRITVEYAGGADLGAAEAGAAEGLLLAAWAASRLGWRAVGGDPSVPPSEGRPEAPMLFRLARPSEGVGEVIVRRRAAAASGAPGVAMLSMSHGDIALSLARAEDSQCVIATSRAPGGCRAPRTARVVERDEATLLGRGLEEGGRDPLFEESLRLAARMIATAADPKETAR